jgi:BatD DUF11 like domain
MKTSSHHHWLFYLMLTLLGLLSSNLYAADIQVKIDRNNVELNETFTLTFEASADVDDDPDFSPLEKDFQVLNKGTSSNISIINGQYQKNMRWNVTLMPLREGTITIPSIEFGSDKSPQYQIKIRPVQTSASGSSAEFISEISISTQSTYPQAQVIVTQRLLSSSNINGYEFSKLSTSGVDVSIQPLGELKQYQTERGGTPYLVLEQRYTLYPQAAGKLTIEPSIATARITFNNRSSRDPFRGNTKTMRRASEKRDIIVKPVPGSFKGKHWLPATEVQLVEAFPQGRKFKVGEPITRTLSLLVDGQSASQLPEFTIAEIHGLKQYPDKPVLNDTPSTADTNAGIVGAQQIKVAIIPSHAGSFTLPAISVPWWNVNTNKMEVAKIAARTFNVAAADTSGASVAPTGKQPALVVTPTENTQAPAITAPEKAPSSNALLWQIISLLLFVALLSSLFMLWRANRSMQVPIEAPHVAKPSLKQSYKQLGKACLENDAKQCKDALLNWGQTVFNESPIYSLGELAARVEPTLAGKINELNSALYKNQIDSWQCDGLIELCKGFERGASQQNNHTEKNKLENLTP